MSELKLLCGDPDQTPASYTRFVLPFAYQPEPWKGRIAERQFMVEEDPGLLRRRRYFTDEIGEALFTRARWFSLFGGDGKAWHQDFRIRLGRADVQVILGAGMVLLEWTIPRQRDLLRVGFVWLDAYFGEGTPLTLDQLLQFNEEFRFWLLPYVGHKRKFMTGLSGFPFLESTSRSDDQAYLAPWEELLKLPICTDDKHYRLFPAPWFKEARAALLSPDVALDKRGWLVHADSRTFVWTCAMSAKGSQMLEEAWEMLEPSPGDSSCRRKKRPEPFAFGHWIKLLNVDKPGTNEKGEPEEQETHKATAFEKEWAAAKTYKRWTESGTLYGFCYHSGAMLGKASKSLPIHQHFKRIYFDQQVLLLYLRTALFRFSKEISSVTCSARGSRSSQWELREHFLKLREDFAFFTNLYQYPLLSNQQQGLELYQLSRTEADVDRLFEEMESEIKNTAEFLAQQWSDLLTKLGIALTVVSLLGISALSDPLLAFLARHLEFAPPGWLPDALIDAAWPRFWAATVLVLLPAALSGVLCSLVSWSLWRLRGSWKRLESLMPSLGEPRSTETPPRSLASSIQKTLPSKEAGEGEQVTDETQERARQAESNREGSTN